MDFHDCPNKTYQSDSMLQQLTCSVVTMNSVVYFYYVLHTRLCPAHRCSAEHQLWPKIVVSGRPLSNVGSWSRCAVGSIHSPEWRWDAECCELPNQCALPNKCCELLLCMRPTQIARLKVLSE